jgi:hypothetical protein
MIDDLLLENGATYLLAKSCEFKTYRRGFYKNSDRAVGKRDILF